MLLTEEEKKKRWEAAYTSGSHLPKNMRRATMALFWEHRHKVRWQQRGITPLFTLKPYDNNDCLSFPQLYFQCNSEYEFAMVVLGDWKHWERLKETDWFKPLLEEWEREKIERDIAYGRAKIRELAAKGNLSACKYLAGGSKEDVPAKPNKPTKPTPTKEPELPSNTAEHDEWLEQSLQNLEK